MTRLTRQATREAVATGASPGLMGPLYSDSVSSRTRGGAGPGLSATGSNPNFGSYRDATEPKDSPPVAKPPPPAGPTGTDGISFDPHQNKYEHYIGSPHAADQIFPHQRPKQGKGRSRAARKATVTKAATSSSSDTSSSSSDDHFNSDDNSNDTISLGPGPTPAIPTPSPHTTVPATPASPPDFVTPELPTRKRRSSSDIFNPLTRQFTTPPDKGKGRVISQGESWRTGAEIHKDSPPRDKMEDIQATGKSPIQPSPDKMSICSQTPDMTPARTEFLRKKQEEFEGMKRQIGDLTFKNVKIELELLERKGKWDLLQKQVKDLTEENIRLRTLVRTGPGSTNSLATLEKQLKDLAEENMRWRTLTNTEPGSTSGTCSFIAFEKQLKNSTEENERWNKIKKETTNRIRPLAALLKVIHDEFHVDRESDADYIHWKNVLKG